MTYEEAKDLTFPCRIKTVQVYSSAKRTRRIENDAVATGIFLDDYQEWRFRTEEYGHVPVLRICEFVSLIQVPITWRCRPRNKVCPHCKKKFTRSGLTKHLKMVHASEVPA